MVKPPSPITKQCNLYIFHALIWQTWYSFKAIVSRRTRSLTDLIPPSPPPRTHFRLCGVFLNFIFTSPSSQFDVPPLPTLPLPFPFSCCSPLTYCLSDHWQPCFTDNCDIDSNSEESCLFLFPNEPLRVYCFSLMYFNTRLRKKFKLSLTEYSCHQLFISQVDHFCPLMCCVYHATWHISMLSTVCPADIMSLLSLFLML